MEGKRSSYTKNGTRDWFQIPTGPGPYDLSNESAAVPTIFHPYIEKALSKCKMIIINLYGFRALA
jgi:hypothetical protein